MGLQLTVTPHVHDGETVRLEVSQEITNIVPEAPIGNAGFSDVVTSKRTIETAVLADDQQTIMLGGLIQDDITINDATGSLSSAASRPLAGCSAANPNPTRSETC